MSGVIEPAASGRAKCRGCGERIAKGDLRFGESTPNAYGDGDAVCWFHILCGACRRPEPFAAARAASNAVVPDAEFIETAVRTGVAHPRISRVAGVQRASSGRSRCRQCRKTIANSAWRLVLQIWEEHRFAPIGFVHVGCALRYVGFDDPGHLLTRISKLTAELSDAELREIELLLREPDAVGLDAPG